MSDNQRETILRNCLSNLHQKFKRDIPKNEWLDREVKSALDDFRWLKDFDLEEMFAHAIKQHDSRFLPTNKDILKYWKNYRVSKDNTKSECRECDSSGFISARDVEKYTYAFRCSCSNGNQLSLKIPSWGVDWEQKGCTRL